MTELPAGDDKEGDDQDGHSQGKTHAQAAKRFAAEGSFDGVPAPGTG